VERRSSRSAALVAGRAGRRGHGARGSLRNNLHIGACLVAAAACAPAEPGDAEAPAANGDTPARTAASRPSASATGGAGVAPPTGGAGGAAGTTVPAARDAAASPDAAARPLATDAASPSIPSTPLGTRDASTSDARPAPGSDAGVEAGPAAASASDDLYDPERLPRFDLTIPPASVAALDKDGRTYVPATFKYNDEVVANVGVHLKGEFSFRPLGKKAAFKIKFDEFTPDRTYRGLKRLTFNNMMEDPSFIAERLAYFVFRSAGLPAPRANSALVYVNGTFYGVYANIETEDKTFLKRFFRSNDGNLYEESGKDLTPGNEASFQLETNEAANDRADLRALIAAIAAAKDATLLADLDATLDTAHFLKFAALEALVNQWDMYAYTHYGPNNFRLYDDPTTKKFTFLPWGMDMTFKQREGKYEWHVPLFMPAQPAGVIHKRCLRSPACREAYRKVVVDLLKLYESLDLAKVAERYYGQIRAEVLKDTRKETSNAGFEAAYQSVLRVIREKPGVIRAQLGT
jgi:hypothetical protein